MTERDWDRDDYEALFIMAVNHCEPDHPYYDDPYPIGHDDVKQTWCRSDSSYWAKCGPRGKYNKEKVALFSVDLGHFNRKSSERVLSVIAHEITHITEGSHTRGSEHNPTFWDEMTDNALDMIEIFEEFEEFFGERLSMREYAQEVVDDVNSSMIDGRMVTLEEQKQMNREAMSPYIG